MPTARKLPSGSWRCRAFSHYEVAENGKKKAVYRSFISKDTSARGKKKCELEAAAWVATKETSVHCDLTVEQAMKKYIEVKRQVLSPSTVIGYEPIVRNRIGMIAGERIETITHARIQQWVSDLCSRYSLKTVKNTYGFFVSVVGMFTCRRLQKVTFAQSKKKELYVPTEAEIAMLVSSMDEPIRTITEIAAFGGLRRSEICALTRDDVKDTYIAVNKAMVYTTQNEWVIKPPKTEASNRDVFLPPELMAKLKAMPKGMLFDLNPTSVTHYFTMARNALDLQRVHFHSLRHFFASYNHALGIPDQYIMQMGGWSTDRVLKSVYRGTIKPQMDVFTQQSLAGMNKIMDLYVTKYVT